MRVSARLQIVTVSPSLSTSKHSLEVEWGATHRSIGQQLGYGHVPELSDTGMQVCFCERNKPDHALEPVNISNSH